MRILIKIPSVIISIIIIVGVGYGDETDDRIFDILGSEVPKETFIQSIDHSISPKTILKETDREFTPGVIIDRGVYYIEEEGQYIASPLPPHGAKVIVLAMAELYFPELKKTREFYYIECEDETTGWVNSNYIYAHFGYHALVNVDNLNVYNLPSTDAEVTGQLTIEDEVRIRLRSREKETIDGVTDYWYQIAFIGDEWIFGAYLEPLLTYDLMSMLYFFGSVDHQQFEMIKDILNNIQSLPDKPYGFDKFSVLTGLEEPTYHVQAYYYVCISLLSPLDSFETISPEIVDQLFEWSEMLTDEYRDYKVYDIYLFDCPAQAEGLWFQMRIYEYLRDRENFEKTLMEIYTNYGTTKKWLKHEYHSFYGLDIVDEYPARAAEIWGEDYALSLLDKLYEKSPNKFIEAKVLIEKGILLAGSEGLEDEAIDIFAKVIEDYAGEEHNYYYNTYMNAGQAAVLETLDMLPDEESKREFLLPLTAEEVPFPVRYFAVFLLANGKEGFSPDPANFNQLYEELWREEHPNYFFEYFGWEWSWERYHK